MSWSALSLVGLGRSRAPSAAAGSRRPDTAAVPPARSGRSWRLRPLQVAIVLAALLGSVFASGVVLWLGQERARAGQERVTEHAGGELRQRVDQAAQLVVGARALFESAPDVSEAQFARFASVSLGSSGLLGLGWIPRVAAGERQRYERTLGQRVSEPAGRRLRPAGRRAAYFPLTYMAPEKPKANRILGVDFGSVPAMAATLAAARDSGEPTLSGALPMLAVGDAAILYAPVYGPGARPRTRAERRARLRGFVAAGYSTETLVQGARRDLPAGAAMQVLDGARVLSGPSAPLAGASSQDVVIAGRVWTVRVAAHAGATLALPAGILAAGLLFSLLMALLLAQTNRRQEELRSQRDYASGMVGAMQDGLVVVAPDGRVTEVSPGFCQLTGFARGDLIGAAAPYPYWPEATMEALERGFERVRRDGSAEWDLVFRRRDGDRVPVILKASVLEDERGGVAGYLATIKDVTERARAEEAQARQASIVRAVLDTAPEAIRMVDLDGTTVVANSASEDFGWGLAGATADAYAGAEDLIRRSTDPARFGAAIRALREDSERSDCVEFELSESGRIFRLYSAPVRLDADPGSVIGRMFITREVTDERRSERAKDEFIQLASHELRTPLTSILGYLEVLRDGDAGELTAQQERFLRVVDRNAQRLLRLVGDLLVVARADADRLGLQMAEVDLGALAAECAAEARPLAQERRIALTVEAEPAPVRGDRTRLAEVVDNLISNALKFTPPGGAVDVRVSLRGGEAALEVRDTGMGISAADQARLFERFFRTEAAMRAAIPGTGLGLCISRMLVEAQRGRIAVESEVGRGSVFRVSLPLALRPAAAVR